MALYVAYVSVSGVLVIVSFLLFLLMLFVSGSVGISMYISGGVGS